MPYRLVMLVASTTLLIGCGIGNTPAPVYGVDIVAVNQGQVVPFNGTLFSPFYLDKYLQWKDAK